MSKQLSNVWLHSGQKLHHEPISSPNLIDRSPDLHKLMRFKAILVLYIEPNMAIDDVIPISKLFFLTYYKSNLLYANLSHGFAESLVLLVSKSSVYPYKII